VSLIDIKALLPLIIPAASAVFIMLVISVYRDHLLTFLLTITGLLFAFASLFAVSSILPLQVTRLLVLDSYALFFMGLIILAAVTTAIFSYGYLSRSSVVREEYYLLLLLAVVGSCVLVASSHFISFFLGLETLSVSLYPLIAYQRSGERGIEAGIKYLVLAAVSSAFLLFGMALIYFEAGTMEFSRLSLLLNNTNTHSIIFLSGTVLMLTGIGFKLGVVPFHLWTPDVYEGAPAPVTGFIATVSKGAVFALLLRYFGGHSQHFGSPLFTIFAVIAAASMLAGNLLALFQNNVKRILAYSSISHLGYLLVAFLAGGELAVTAVTFYLVAYFVTSLGAFGMITVLSDGTAEAGTLDHFQSLASDRPWLAGVFAAMIFSLAGIPLTAGFVGKFYLLYAGVTSALWFLVILLVISSAIGLFYYLRIIRIMFERKEKTAQEKYTFPPVPLAGAAMLAMLLIILLLLGVYPSPLIQLIQNMAGLP
jgi:NADH-quinone oxidoreductase subunit N